MGRLHRSRSFVAVSILTAVSFAVSSIASAQPLIPQLPAVSANNPHAGDARFARMIQAVRWDGSRRGDGGRRHDGASRRHSAREHGRNGSAFRRGGHGQRRDAGPSRHHRAYRRDDSAFRRGSHGVRRNAGPSGYDRNSGRAARQPMQFRRGPGPTTSATRDGGRTSYRGSASAQGYRGRNAGPSQPRYHSGPPPRHDYRGPDRGHDRGKPYRGYDRYRYDKHRYGKYRYGGPSHRTVVIGRPYPPGPWYYVPPHRRYFYRNVWVVRPYGHWYRGYGYYDTYADAYPWLAFTAITLSVLTLLTVAQQRAHEQAQIEAATAPVGSTIEWNEGSAYGAVSVLRDGQSTSGKYCREFLQTVTVGGRSEQAYGTACRQPDGSWRIVATR